MNLGRPETEYGFMTQAAFELAVQKEIEKFFAKKKEEDYNTWLYHKELNRIWSEDNPGKFPDQNDLVVHDDGRAFSWRLPEFSMGYTWVEISND